jgi:hypothetical protein
MANTITFGSLSLSALLASQRDVTRSTSTSDKLLLNGKHSVQTNVNTGLNETYILTGTWADFDALLALVGTFQTLTIVTLSTTYTYTNCVISGEIGAKEISPTKCKMTVKFVQQTG